MKRTQGVRENKINEEEEKRWDKADTELPEQYYHGLEDLPWNLDSLEQLLYISLPAWIQRALLCNLAERFGIWTFHNNTLPCRLLSYTLLPYTLPASAGITFIYRFLCWVKKMPHQVLNAGREFKQEVITHPRLGFAHLRGLLPNRFLLLQIPTLHPCSALFLAPWSCFPSLPFTFLPWSSFPLLSLAWRFVPRCLSSSTSKNQPECRSQTQPLWSRRRSLLCFQLTGSGGFCKKTDDILTDAEPPSSAFLLQLNLELEMDSYSELQLQKDRPDCEGSSLLNTEVEENLSSPFISDMDLQEED
nr:patatin-like phospholipase domain-containing protein 2-like [Gymnocypris przewalskii]